MPHHQTTGQTYINVTNSKSFENVENSNIWEQ
jgi:hypothetical protein